MGIYSDTTISNCMLTYLLQTQLISLNDIYMVGMQDCEKRFYQNFMKIFENTAKSA